MEMLIAKIPGKVYGDIESASSAYALNICDETESDEQFIETKEHYMKGAEKGYLMALDDLSDLIYEIEHLKVCLQEAPVEFTSISPTKSQALREEQSWNREWQSAYKKVLSFKRKFYEMPI